ncbi:HD-GYP domain-containing protein [Aminobacterium mobile]|uniref:HD-GYP domain-containing protein n=1 Tax=Aminobacterium mobile TaxID=81467 RepID=UPI0004664CBC|nr:HD domain-containing protein [Aminobacterium mobile]
MEETIKVSIKDLEKWRGIIVEDVMSRDKAILIPQGTDVQSLFVKHSDIIRDLKRHHIEWVWIRPQHLLEGVAFESFSHIFPELDPPLLVISPRFAEVISYQFEVFCKNIQNKRVRREGIRSFLYAGNLLQDEVCQASSIPLSLFQSDDKEEKKYFIHSINVALLSGFIVKQLFPHWKDTIKKAIIAGLLHDIGKTLLALPSEEQEKHTVLGEALIREGGVEDEDILEGVRYHHERWDGRGSCGLKEEEIPLMGRIVAVANSFDSLSQQNITTSSQRLSFVITNAGVRFDPFIVQVLLSTLGLYPPGSVVELSDHRKAVVIETRFRNILQPRVYISEEEGASSKEGKVLDLERVPSLFIRKVCTDVIKKPIENLSDKVVIAPRKGYIYEKYTG